MNESTTMSYLLFPKNIRLPYNKNISISKEKARDEEAFSLLIPENKTDAIVNYLKNHAGFKNAIPSFDKGEEYGISRIIKAPWELHLRIYSSSYFPDFSKIYAHIEIARKYVEHLNFRYVQPVVYEPFKFYKNIFSELIVAYESKYIVEHVNENYWFKILNPDKLTPVSPASIIGFTATSISSKIKNYFSNPKH